MNVQTISREITELPSDVQREVFDFVEFLRVRYRSSKEDLAKKQRPISQDPFIGIWKGRKDMKDSSHWVRTLRKKEWS